METKTIHIDCDADLQDAMRQLAAAENAVLAAQERMWALRGIVDYLTQKRAQTPATEEPA